MFSLDKIRWNRGLLSFSWLSRWTIKLNHKNTPAIEPFELKDRLKIGPFELSLYHHRFSQINNRKNPNIILGISGSWHDSAAVILQNGKILAALEEERVSRNKHDSSQFPVGAIDEILTKFHLHWNDIDHIAIGWDYNRYIDTPHCSAPSDHQFQRLDETYARQKNVLMDRVKRRNVPERNKARYQPQAVIDFLDLMGQRWRTSHRPPISFVKHHWAHAASAYYPCGLPEPVLVITIDGYGDGETTTVWVGQDSHLKKITSVEIPHSLGWVYSSVTEYLGFQPNAGEGEVMALAPYGAPRSPYEEQLVVDLRRFMDDFVTVNHHDGTFRVNPEFFCYGDFLPGRVRVTQQMIDRLSPIVPPHRKIGAPLDPNCDQDRPYCNLAFVLQEKTEAAVVNLVQHFLQHDSRTQSVQSVALAGGVAFNINANGRLITDGLVDPDHLFIQPAAGDAGAALGAAMVVSHDIYNTDPRFLMTRVDWGLEYCDEEVEAALTDYGLQEGRNFRKVGSLEEMAGIVASLLAKNNVVAWFQGRSEFGPRALGYRSILLNITNPLANELANNIKLRQHWRPSAMSILREDAADFIKELGPESKAPFMIMAYHLTKQGNETIPSGLHPVNGSTRLHTVIKGDNPLFWQVLHELWRQTGIPAVVNTSFNISEPIVENPSQALNTFFKMEAANFLSIGKVIVWKYLQNH